MKAPSFACTCDWILPVESPPIPNGWIVVVDGIIDFVGDQLPQRFDSLPQRNLGHGAILPGLINSHCHLEFSDLEVPINVPDQGCIVDWLSEVIKHRRSLAGSMTDPIAHRRATYEKGLREAYCTGTRFLIDNITAPWSADWVAQAAYDFGPIGLRVASAIELVDVTQERARETLQFAKSVLSTPAKSLSLIAAGLAPHAPYTASKRLVAQAVSIANEKKTWVSMHLAESTQELSWTKDRTGPFANWITPWTDDAHRREIGTIEDILLQLQAAPKTLIAHGNYLSQGAIDILAQSPNQFAVVYCPRTHRHFGHAKHPLGDLVLAGVPILLGTDSRASNPDLSIFREWQTACREFPEIHPRKLLTFCTTSPRNFFSTSEQFGKLAERYPPALTWISFQPQTPNLIVNSSTIQNSEESTLWLHMLTANDACPIELHPSLRAFFAE